jgi:glycine cleavage system H protein
MRVYFTKEHEWIKIEGSTATVGITAYAVEQLGDITFVELPAVGNSFRQFDVLCGIESVKAASDIYAPLGGKVVAVNEALMDHPEIINESPEEDGWLARIETGDGEGTEKLLNRDQYDDYVRELE